MTGLAIHIITLNKIIKASPGDNIYRALAEAGLVDAPCGGLGHCGQCGVRFINRPPPANELDQVYFTEERLLTGWRLACQHTLRQDIEIELSPFVAWREGGAFWRSVRKEHQPSADLAHAAQQVQAMGLAIDIGTTNIAAVLLQLPSGSLLSSATCQNSQKAYGHDVVSRIAHAAGSKGLWQLRNAILRDIRQLLDELCQKSACKPQGINIAVIAANPAMVHFLAGIDPTPLGQAPYRLAFVEPLQLSASQFELPLANEAEFYCLPAASAYLGGDMVGGLMVADFDLPGLTRLMLDIGTNGEIALSHKGRIWACSAAAGPAF
ncbi:MAG: ASKHA domain-containing protein, partial [Clostridiales bacterium]|nr:ASKHA domain-containing protein [Clostridiales bacterium]